MSDMDMDHFVLLDAGFLGERGEEDRYEEMVELILLGVRSCVELALMTGIVV